MTLVFDFIYHSRFQDMEDMESRVKKNVADIKRNEHIVCYPENGK